jgi:hypothetical protein
MPDVTPDDVRLIVWRAPEPPDVEIVQRGDPALKGDAAVSGVLHMRFPRIFALAMVTLRGTPGEEVNFWRLGFIQLGFINTDWAKYQNVDPADGSVFVRRDRPPALSQQLCRDYAHDVGIKGLIRRFPYMGPIIFYDPETPMRTWLNPRVTAFPLGTKIPANGKLIVEVLFSDSPRPAWWGLNRVNQTTVRENQIYSVQYSRALATMFAVQKGRDKPIQVLKSFQWNVRWHAHFGFVDGKNVKFPARPGDVMDMNISHVVKGTPNNPLFQFRVFDTTLPICNSQIPLSVENQVVREARGHADWEASP